MPLYPKTTVYNNNIDIMHIIYIILHIYISITFWFWLNLNGLKLLILTSTSPLWKERIVVLAPLSTYEPINTIDAKRLQSAMRLKRGSMGPHALYLSLGDDGIFKDDGMF